MKLTQRRNRRPFSEGSREVLKLSTKKQHQGTVYRHYLRWREKNGIPLRCDEPACELHLQEPEWNGKPLRLILDHKDGNPYDNKPTSLRLLCPNCDSQLPTKGGRNRGRVVSVVEGGYTLRNKDGTFIVAASMVPATGSSITSTLESNSTTKPGEEGA